MLFKSKNQSKIFCVSMQRTGTTSVGQFFKNHNYRVADWGISHKNKWSYSWEQGDFETIFNSRDFKDKQVFEDAPWWLPEFYKVLFHRFPNAKFILFTRNEDAWFNSMMSHSGGKILGNTKRHCKVYRREEDFYNLFPNQIKRLEYSGKNIDNLLELKGFEEHYKGIYRIQNKEIKDFFAKNAPDSLFTCELEDSEKWKKLSNFMNIKRSDNFDVHENQSKH